MAGQGPPRSRLPLILGLAVASAGGYYLYTAGGDPKVAQKQVEHDAARASSAIKNDLPGREKEARKQGEAKAQEFGAKFDKTVDDARSKLGDAEAKANQYRKETGKDLQNKIDQADKKVEEGAAKAKSGVSGWFGGGK
ncbi:MAG: hypothetical protein M4579_002162 [Chaenotheca gracillima]|nr:MAG: hypothetical protein M4579_002162 [Chaenotheca gracillima]